MHIRLAALLLAAALLLTGCAAPDRQSTEIGTSAELELFFFDAGKADAILLTTKHSAVLIDTGEKGFGKTILTKLADLGVEKLDYLILTHFDKDHIGGAAKVLGGIPVDTVLQSNQPKDSSEYENYLSALREAGITPVTVRETMTFSLDGVLFTVDPPRQAAYNEDSSNNSSLIVSVVNGENRFLFLGDAQSARLEEFLQTDPTGFDLVKLPHHGRDEPLLDALLSQITPTYALITSSDEEPESEAVVKTLERADVRVLLTKNGAVSVLSDGKTLSLTQASP